MSTIATVHELRTVYSAVFTVTVYFISFTVLESAFMQPLHNTMFAYQVCFAGRFTYTEPISLPSSPVFLIFLCL